VRQHGYHPHPFNHSQEFIQISRDPRTLAITFIMPIMQLILLGYAATNDVATFR